MLLCGIVGLANVGKSTLFNALLKKQVAVSANYPFTTIEPNVGVVEVPDDRLQKLADVVKSSEGLNPGFKIIPATVRFVDIAGLVKGAHKGEGLGNQFLSHIREVDVIVFVLRGFKNEDIIRSGSIDPKDDLEVLKEELLLKDLETIDKRLETLPRELKGLAPTDQRHRAFDSLNKAKESVGGGKWLADVMDAEDLERIRDLQLLSAKKTIVIINSDEGDLGKVAESERVKELEIIGSIKICAKLEEELASLSDDEQKEYLKELGIEESGLERLIKEAYGTLGLATFLTAGPKEVRAWTIKRGMLAPAAAGVIHTDFERGFIAADIVPNVKFVELGGWQKAKDAGAVKTIGKHDEVKDGYVVEFKFSI